MAVLVAAAAAAREPAAWAAIAALLLLGAAVPRLNPFDALHALLARRGSRRVFLPGARAPRRFAQLLPALFCLAAAVGLLLGHEAVAWGVVAALGAAFAGIFAFGFCFGSWLFRLLVPAWRPPQERAARTSTAGVPRVTGTASGDGLRTPPRTPHESSEPSEPLAGLAGGAGLRTPPRTPSDSSTSSERVAGLAGGAGLRTPPRTPHESSKPS